MELKRDGAQGGAGQHIFFQHLVFHLLLFLAPSLLYRCLPGLLFPFTSSALPALAVTVFSPHLCMDGPYLFFLVHVQHHPFISFLDPFFPLLLSPDSVPYPSSSFWNTLSAWCPGTNVPCE